MRTNVHALPSYFTSKISIGLVPLVAVIAIRVSHTTSGHCICASSTHASLQPVVQHAGSVVHTFAPHPVATAGGWPGAHMLSGVTSPTKQVPESSSECSV